MSAGNFNFDDTSTVASTARKIKDPIKSAWVQTQWVNLSWQAQTLDLPGVLDPQTMLLDKAENKGLWKLLNRLYDFLGPEKAPFATPVMLPGGTVEWRNYADGCRGVVAEIVEQ